MSRVGQEARGADATYARCQPPPFAPLQHLNHARECAGLLDQRRRRAATERHAGVDLGVHSNPYLEVMAALTVSALADSAGVRPDTIRYYEKAGLLPPPARSAAGYRLYADAMTDRVQFIKGAQRAGLRLREIAQLLEIHDHGQCPCGHTEDLVRRRVVEIDAEIARLQVTHQRLTQLADDCPADLCPEQDWPCADQFIQAGKEVNSHGPGLPLPTDTRLPLPLLTPERI